MGSGSKEDVLKSPEYIIIIAIMSGALNIGVPDRVEFLLTCRLPQQSTGFEPHFEAFDLPAGPNLPYSRSPDTAEKIS
jgi:hypothetical protein